jgi:uncharacterized protein
MIMNEKLIKLKEILKGYGSAVAAFSGGLDSTFLASIAQEVLGDKTLAVTSISPSLPSQDRRDVEEEVKVLGLRHRFIETHELEDERYVTNPENRCFFCKDELFRQLSDLAKKEGYAVVLDGFNADDTRDFRPGQKAGEEWNVKSPLLEAGLTKAEIRDLARERNLKAWDKPQSACLSSRIPYGTSITIQALKQIDAAETALRNLGFKQVRVRHHDRLARIEVERSEISRLLSDGVMAQVSKALKEVGYLFVTVDLEGYRTGSMNEAIKKPAGLGGS